MAFTPSRITRRARNLRRSATSAEARLWRALRNRGFNGFKFLRQVPIGPYTVDFLCREERLIVEVDGATHSEDPEISRDRRREAYLKAQDYRIIRVLNDEVYRHLDGVLETILAGLERKL